MRPMAVPRAHRPSSAPRRRWVPTKSILHVSSPISISIRALWYRHRPVSGGPFSSKMPVPSDVCLISNPWCGKTAGL